MKFFFGKYLFLEVDIYHFDELIFLMDEIGDFNHKKGKNDVIEYLLNAYLKLSIKFSEKKDEIKGKIQNNAFC